MTMLRIASR